MKKVTQSKLLLSRQTLRELATHEIGQIAGGGNTNNCPPPPPPANTLALGCFPPEAQ